MITPVRSMTLLTLAAAGLMAADAPAPVAVAATEAAPAAAPAPAPAAAPAATQQPILSAIKDNDLKITIGGQLQARADWSQSNTSAEQPYDISSGTANAKSDDLDLYMRRVRLYVKGSWQDYTFNFGLRADNADRKDNSTTTSSNQRGFEIHNASVTRTFKTGSVTHGIQVGLDYAFFNSAASGNSTAQLTAATRATEQIMAPRGTGIGYRVNAPWVTFGADVQNNNKVTLASGTATGDGDTVAPADSARYQSEGLCYTARLEITPTNDWQLKSKDAKESYAGKSGHGALWAVETGYNQHDLVPDVATNTVGGSWVDTWVIGTEAQAHINDLSALIEYRWTRQTTNTDAGEPTSTATASNPVYASIFLVQAGYALPCPLVSGAVVEPVARYTHIDLNHAIGTESASYGSNDYATASGNQYEIGANWYPSAGVYSNKISLLYQHWLGEDSGATAGNVTPKADIVRVQYQFLF